MAELLAITEEREAGGFVATVTVTTVETGPGVRWITDRLYGHDAAGEEASLTWVGWYRDDFEPDPALPLSRLPAATYRHSRRGQQGSYAT